MIEWAHRALDEVQRLERIMTVYRTDSDLSCVNRNAASGPVTVVEELLDVLQMSIDVYAQTRGAFDITSGILSRCWGFKDRKGAVPSDSVIQDCMSRVGSKHVTLDVVKRTVKFDRSGLELNLGSIGKGFALDRAARMLQNAEFGKVLLHAGHSSMMAVGDASYPGGGWVVGIRHPMSSDQDLLSLRLRDQALGTSGVGEQHFKQQGKSYGHILDPRTGRPSERNLSASCVAPSSALADALATAFFVMSLSSVETFCQENQTIGAIIVPRPQKDGPVEPRFFGVASSCLAS
jgi:thiamine biosynthesis lipoprotein